MPRELAGKDACPTPATRVFPRGRGKKAPEGGCAPHSPSEFGFTRSAARCGQTRPTSGGLGGRYGLGLTVTMQSARKERGLQAAETPASSDRARHSERVLPLTNYSVSPQKNGAEIRSPNTGRTILRPKGRAPRALTA